MSDILMFYTEEIKKAFEGQLKSIVLYGSKAGAQDAGLGSDHNLLVIVENVLTEQLALLAAGTKKWVKAGNPPPVIFTAAEFASSADVFPIEFLDMKEGSKLLYGDDPLAGINVSGAHLRHELEFELRSKLLKLRQSYIALKGNPKAMRDLLAGSVSGILVLFRHAAALLGEKRPVKKIDSLLILAKKTGLKSDIFRTVHEMKHGDKTALKLDPEKQMSEYMLGVETIIKVIDNLGK